MEMELAELGAVKGKHEQNLALSNVQTPTTPAGHAVAETPDQIDVDIEGAGLSPEYDPLSLVTLPDVFCAQIKFLILTFFWQYLTLNFLQVVKIVMYEPTFDLRIKNTSRVSKRRRNRKLKVICGF